MLQTIGRVSSGSDVRSRAADSADEADGEKGKFGDPKKLYKQNKELVKQNAQLGKLIDNLKHEKESLSVEKNKLKSDLKSTEKELKKATTILSSARAEVERLRAKSHKHSATNMGEVVEELKARVRQLEAELDERDAKLSRFRKRVSGRINRLESGNTEENEDDNNVTQQLHVEQEVRGRLEGEKSELQLRVMTLESDLNQLLQIMDDQQREDLVLSTEQGNFKEISQTLSTFSGEVQSSTNSDFTRGGQDSPSPFPSPRSSPALHHKNKTSVDITTLQTCLHLTLEEKKTAEQQRESLHAELARVKSEMEKAKREWLGEKDELLKQLQKVREENEARQASVEHDKHKEEVVFPEMEVSESSSSQNRTRHPSSSVSTPITGSTEQQKTDTALEYEKHKDEVFFSETPQSEISSSQWQRSSSGSTSIAGNTEQQMMDKRVTEHGKDRPQKAKKVGRRGQLQKQGSRETFTAALAIFQSGEASTFQSEPKREHSTSETSPSDRSSASSTPDSSVPRNLATESRSQSVAIVNKPPIHPPSVPSGDSHSRQGSTNENCQKSPSKTSTAKKMGWTIAQRRKSFEDQIENSSSKPTVHAQHNRTTSSPVITRTSGPPLFEREKTNTLEDQQKVEDNNVREKAQQNDEKTEPEIKRRQEAKVREGLRKERVEREERERAMEEKERKEREEREKKELEIKRRHEAEEKERLRKERDKRKEMEEKERARKEKEEKERKEREERQRRMELENKRREEKERLRKEREKEREEREKEHKKALEEKRRHEREERKQEELEKKRQLDEKKRQEQQAQWELQRTKEAEREQIRKQREGNQREEKKRVEEKLQLEEEKRMTEKAAQASTEPPPNKVKSSFGSIATRRAAFEQNSSPSTSPIILRRNTRSPAQRPKSMDISALMSTPSTSSPTLSPSSSNIASISIKTSISPQSSPKLNQRKEIKEVTVGRSTTIPKPSPPVTASNNSATVPVVTTSSSPPFRRAHTILSSSISQAVSTPDLSSVGKSSGPSSPVAELSTAVWSPGAQRRTLGLTAPKSPLSDRKMAKSVSFSPNLSIAGRSGGISRPSAPPVATSNKMNGFRTRLGIPGTEDIKKAQSLQNIPEHAPADNIAPSTTSHVPTASRVQRRPRAERAKTTSLSHADTASLTNLISKMQQKEKRPIENGVDHTVHNRPTARPTSMYGSITPTRYVFTQGMAEAACGT